MMRSHQRKGFPPIVDAEGVGELKKIEEELVKYSWKAIAEFERVFAPQLYYDPKTKTWDGYLQNVYAKEGKENVVNITITYAGGHADFWIRWNRFKNLLVFI